MEEATPLCRLPLALLPDGALGLLLSFGSVSDIIAANMVCRSWVMHGNRTHLWKVLGATFEVAMPKSLGPEKRFDASARGSARGAGKRLLRSAANAKRTFFKSYAASVTANRYKHDSTLSEAYTLFRKQDSVQRLRSLLRRRWGIAFQAPSKPSACSSRTTTGNPVTASSCQGGVAECGASSAGDTRSVRNRIPSAFGSASATGGEWRGKGLWTFDVNHRHGIWEGNTLLNFAVRCGRRKCVDFVLAQMGANTEIPDDGGFTPLLNSAWRGDTPLLKQLLAGGSRLDVTGVSRGVGPYSPLEWADHKGRLETATFLRSLAAREREQKYDFSRLDASPRRSLAKGDGTAVQD